MRKNRKKLLLLHTQKNLVKCCWQMKEITRVLKNTQILKNDANNKKKEWKKVLFYLPTPTYYNYDYFYYYNIFEIFFLSLLLHFTQKNIVQVIFNLGSALKGFFSTQKQLVITLFDTCSFVCSVCRFFLI